MVGVTIVKGSAVGVDLLKVTEAFRTALNSGAMELLEEVAPDRADLADLLQTYLNEVPVALSLLEPILERSTPLRLLEVGSGVGAVTACLRSVGYSVVALEPGGPGFEDLLLLEELVRTVSDRLIGGDHDFAPTLRIGVDDLNPVIHGPFDVAFSVNVLEHVPDPLAALGRINAVLEPKGIQRHVCPNYAFPYEPHFFVPLLPFWPSQTARLLPSSVTETGLWSSINFVTARQVRRWARGAEVRVAFDRGVLAEAFERFLADAVFAERHSGLSRIVHMVRRARLIPILRTVPPAAVSPMRFTVSPPQFPPG